MLDILLIVHLVLSFLLIFVILIQKTSADGLSGLSGGGINSGGVFSPQTAASILHKITILLASLFMINALILANLSSFNPHKDIITDTKEEIPIAK